MCRRYLVANAHSSAGIELLGDICAQGGRVMEAIKLYRDALKMDPTKMMLEVKISCIRDANAYTSPNADSAPDEAPKLADPATDQKKNPRRGWLSDFFRR